MAGEGDQEWITVSQAAKILGVTPERVRQRRLCGTLLFQQTPLGFLYDARSIKDEAQRIPMAKSKRLRHCEQCGQPFLRTGSGYREGCGKYCSRACYSLARRGVRMAGGEVYVLTRFDSHGVTDTIGVFGGLQAAKDWHHVEGWRPCRYDRWDAVQGECVYEIERCEVRGEG